VVLPCARIPSIDQLKPPSTVRQAYDVQDRLLVVALNDFSDQKHFTTFLYTAREYQRRGGFRFLIPVYRKDKETIRWRDRLKQIVEQEKLTSTTLLQEGEDIHSLIDSADFTIFADRNPRGFGFPLLVSEALHAGKPVLCFQPGSVSEFVSGFNRNWVCHENEDFSRISKDLAKQAPHLEQISTELARFSRAHLSAQAVLAKYRQLYNSAGSR
jgi:glycosyltransferase involved in cell wall biosynthesis